MRTAILLSGILMIATPARSEFLTDRDRQDLLEQLIAIQNSANERVDARFRAAIRAYNQAMGSNEAAIDLYLNCMEKVRFEDKLKDFREFRDWKRKNDENLDDPGFRLVLRYQLSWLVLILKSGSEDPDMPALINEAMDLMTTIFSNIEKIDTHRSTLSQSVLSSVFAQAYEIGKVETEFAGSPVEIAGTFENVILPPLRTPARLAALRSAWLRRIQLEEMNATRWVNRRMPGDRNGRRDRDQEREAREQVRDERTINEEEFQTKTLPGLIWQMEVDLFNSGDEIGAGSRMLAHIRKYITHQEVRNWAQQLQSLLNPEEEEADGTPVAPPAN